MIADKEKQVYIRKFHHFSHREIDRVHDPERIRCVRGSLMQSPTCCYWPFNLAPPACSFLPWMP